MVQKAGKVGCVIRVTGREQISGLPFPYFQNARGSWQEARVLVLFISLDSGLKKPYLA